MSVLAWRAGALSKFRFEGVVEHNRYARPYLLTRHSRNQTG
jgi:hypothetical protein